MATGMTFRGFDAESAQLILRGPFGKSYLLSTNAERLSPFSHAATILHPRTGRQGTVLGALDDKLYVQFDDDTTATGFLAAQALVELELASSASGAPEDTVEFAGPIGVTYPFNTRSLESVFEVRAGAQHYIKLWNCTVVFVGAFLRIPWVRILGGDRASLPAGVTGPAAHVPNGLKVALPLIGCHTAAALRNVYLLCEVPSGPSGPFISTPRALHSSNVTPALSAVKGVSDAPSSTSTPYRINLAKHVAVCSGPLGTTFDVDMGEQALKAFETRHGERFMVLKGLAAGKLASVVGTQAGTLVVHVDGEPRVTVLRGCNTALDVSTYLARPKGGSGRSSAAAVSGATPSAAAASRVKSEPPSRAVPTPSLAAAVVGGGARDGSPQDLPADHHHHHHHNAVVGSGKQHHSFRCWTAFGRFDFDTRESTIKKFGPFVHEQTVRCTVGPDRGKLFHIVGERTGSLWVIEDKRLRATPLAFCETPADVQLRYGFVPHGRCSLREYATQEEEPPPTPLRRSVSKGGKASETKTDTGGVSAGERDGGGGGAQLSQDQPARGTTPAKPLPAPTVNLVLEPAFAAAASSSSPMRSHAETGKGISAAGANAAAATDNDAALQDRQVSPQATRNYLKAIAMFMLGTTNAKRTPLPFHEYYAADPTKRLSGALKKLDATRDMWNKVHPVRPFGGATTEDLLRLFAKFPQLLP